MARRQKDEQNCKFYNVFITPEGCFKMKGQFLGAYSIGIFVG